MPRASVAAGVIDKKFGGETNLVLLVGSPAGRIDTPASRETGQALVTELKKDKRLSNVVSYWETNSPDLLSEDGREAMVLAHVRGDATQQREYAKGILDTYSGTYRNTLTVQAGEGAAVGASPSLPR
ncbi:hypothetical protein ABZ619_39630 [Streptomyces sp. NPDC007851]|uniref:hypothetical protein n=1 Tax=Streptomyces sp. NPDC007851 TaxID=3155008 RepID=UPI0033FFB5DD